MCNSPFFENVKGLAQCCVLDWAMPLSMTISPAKYCFTQVDRITEKNVDCDTIKHQHKQTCGLHVFCKDHCDHCDDDGDP